MCALIKKLNYLEFVLDHPEKKIATLEINEHLIRYESKAFTNGKVEKHDYHEVNPEKQKNLLVDLNKITFLSWRKQYSKYKIKNSIYWSLCMRYNDNKQIKTFYGYNEFPIPFEISSPFSVDSSTSYTPEFTLLLKALNKTVGKRSFFK